MGPGRSRYRFIAGRLACAGLALALVLGWMTAADAAKPEAGTASRQAREDAIKNVPLAKLHPQARTKVAAVLDDITIFRRLPNQTIECDPAFFHFLIEHPEVVVNVWDVLGLSDVTLTRTGPDTLSANDGAGTKGAVEVLYRSQDTYIWLSEGTYEGHLFSKPLRGRCVFVMRNSFGRDAEGKSMVTCRLDAFIRLDNVTIDLLARVFQPFVGQLADHNFRETASFVEVLYQTAAINGPGMQRLAAKLNQVAPEVRDQFASLSEQIALQGAVAESQPTQQGPIPRQPVPGPVRTARGPNGTVPRSR
jgi:hypothetical protein